jgi:riboflavin synthase
MFTGIVQSVGTVRESVPLAGGVRITIDAGGLDLADVAVGDSIAVNGVCLTAVALGGGGFSADVSRETLDCTIGFATGARVNLEKSLRLADRLGGHLVTGHVDGVGRVIEFLPVGESWRLAIALPRELARYAARKGSIAVNGVSLTVNAVTKENFVVNLIPHTVEATNLQALAPGTPVNIEVDLIARYLERLRAADGEA